MRRTGAHAHLDVHGDEALPHVFASRGLPPGPHLGPGRLRLYESFDGAMLREGGGAYQTRRGYPEGRKLNRRIAATWSSLHLGAVGLTLELPFRDCLELPDASGGWTSALSRTLGAAAVRALGQMVPMLGVEQP
uniref:Uncharacterized protein n=1 Tax=Alexandrium catenella TaxID=2925 RepID=A0A7S1RTB3_ALECA